MTRKPIVALLVASVITTPRPAAAIPVEDLMNLPHNLLAAIEAANQTVTQIREYKTQLEQYQAAVVSGAAVGVGILDAMHNLKKNIEGLTEDLKHQKNIIDEMQDWLGKLDDLDYYRAQPCYGAGAECTKQQWETILGLAEADEPRTRNQRAIAWQQMRTGLDENQETLERDLRQLQKLQQAAQRTRGQLEAEQVGNEMLASMIEQALRMRATIAAYHRVLIVERVARARAEERRKAQRAFYHRRVYRPRRREGRQLWSLQGSPSGSAAPPDYDPLDPWSGTEGAEAEPEPRAPMPTLPTDQSPPEPASTSGLDPTGRPPIPPQTTVPSDVDRATDPSGQPPPTLPPQTTTPSDVDSSTDPSGQPPPSSPHLDPWGQPQTPSNGGMFAAEEETP